MVMKNKYTTRSYDRSVPRNHTFITSSLAFSLALSDSCAPCHGFNPYTAVSHAWSGDLRGRLHVNRVGTEVLDSCLDASTRWLPLSCGPPCAANC